MLKRLIIRYMDPQKRQTQLVEIGDQPNVEAALQSFCTDHHLGITEIECAVDGTETWHLVDTGTAMMFGYADITNQPVPYGDTTHWIVVSVVSQSGDPVPDAETHFSPDHTWEATLYAATLGTQPHYGSVYVWDGNARYSVQHWPDRWLSSSRSMEAENAHHWVASIFSAWEADDYGHPRPLGGSTELDSARAALNIARKQILAALPEARLVAVAVDVYAVYESVGPKIDDIPIAWVVLKNVAV